MTWSVLPGFHKQKSQHAALWWVNLNWQPIGGHTLQPSCDFSSKLVNYTRGSCFCKWKAANQNGLPGQHPLGFWLSCICKGTCWKVEFHDNVGLLCLSVIFLPEHCYLGFVVFLTFSVNKDVCFYSRFVWYYLCQLLLSLVAAIKSVSCYYLCQLPIIYCSV